MVLHGNNGEMRRDTHEATEYCNHPCYKKIPHPRASSCSLSLCSLLPSTADKLCTRIVEKLAKTVCYNTVAINIYIGKATCYHKLQHLASFLHC